MKNLSKAYYKDYFAGVNFQMTSGDNPEITADKDCILKKNKELLSLANETYLGKANQTYASQNSLVTHSFDLKVLYPGLVTGIGLNHEAKIEGEFKLGLHLDYTTGLPIIYGSSVKGVLRSAFAEQGLWEVLTSLFPGKKELDTLVNKLKEVSLSSLADEIFGSDKPETANSIYNRDIFFDAVVCGLNGQASMLTSDAITPHGNNPLQEPQPLAFVRIASGCKIKFRFRLRDSKILKASDKLDLFKFILMALGVGAKTNVGYGRLGE